MTETPSLTGKQIVRELVAAGVEPVTAPPPRKGGLFGGRRRVPYDGPFGPFFRTPFTIEIDETTGVGTVGSVLTCALNVDGEWGFAADDRWWPMHQKLHWRNAERFNTSLPVLLAFHAQG